MVTCLLDTNILIDLLRGYSPAQVWITQQQRPGVSRVVWLEAIEGATDSTTQADTLKLLNDFEIVEMTVSDFDWAAQQLLRYRLSHHIDTFDCLIAAPSYRLQLPIYTRNLKHFSPLLGKLAQQPYA